MTFPNCGAEEKKKMKKNILLFTLFLIFSSNCFAKIVGLNFEIDDPNIEPESVEYYLICIEQCFKLNSIDFAIEYIKEAKEKYPDNIDIILTAGDVFYYQGLAQEEYDYYVKLLEKYPKEYKIYIKKSYTDLDLGKHDEYLEDLLTADKYHKNDAVILGNIGLAYLDKEDYKNAEKYLMKSYKIDKKLTSTLNNLASLNYQIKKYEKALEWAEESLEINSENSYTYRILGYIYKALGRIEESNEAFGKVKYSK